MRFKRLLDLVLNVFAPIAAGSGIYYFSSNHNLKLTIKNQLPDGLWAYAFISTILIIWDRNLHLFWLAAAFCSFFLFELLQFTSFIRGTGDVWDIITYFIFSLLALYTNNHFKKKYEPNTRKN